MTPLEQAFIRSGLACDEPQICGFPKCECGYQIHTVRRVVAAALADDEATIDAMVHADFAPRDSWETVMKAVLAALHRHIIGEAP